jgi:hypothetical protein
MLEETKKILAERYKKVKEIERAEELEKDKEVKKVADLEKAKEVKKVEEYIRQPFLPITERLVDPNDDDEILAFVLEKSLNDK